MTKSCAFCRGSGSFVVQERGSLSLTNIAVDPSATLTVTGGTLSLVSMAVPAAVLGMAETTLSDAGSTLRLDAVTVLEVPNAGVRTGTMTVRADGSKAPEPQGVGEGFFVVTSGPCATYGRCVGRTEGYGPRETCTITVGGSGGVLGPCAVFDTYNYMDHVTLPGGAAHEGSDCTEGAALAPGDAIAWHSSGDRQGSVGGRYPNGCAAKGTCGLPYTRYGPGSTDVYNDCGANADFPCPNGLGGGWELCFA